MGISYCWLLTESECEIMPDIRDERDGYPTASCVYLTDESAFMDFRKWSEATGAKPYPGGPAFSLRAVDEERGCAIYRLLEKVPLFE